MGFLTRVAERISDRSSFYKNALTRLAKSPGLGKRDGRMFERSLEGRTNGSIDARYGCFTLEML
jgi:hypothetical protein